MNTKVDFNMNIEVYFKWILKYILNILKYMLNEY